MVTFVRFAYGGSLRKEKKTKLLWLKPTDKRDFVNNFLTHFDKIYDVGDSTHLNRAG